MTSVLPPGQGWQLVGEGYTFTEGPAVNAKGEVFFTDVPKNRVYRVSARRQGVSVQGGDGRRQRPDVWRRRPALRRQSASKRIVAWDAEGRESVLADGIEPNDLAVTHAGNIYVSEPAHKQVWLVTAKGDKRIVR